VIAHQPPSHSRCSWAVLATASGIRRSVVHVFEPASERGKKGLEELQQQVVGVLSFKKLKTEVFDTNSLSICSRAMVTRRSSPRGNRAAPGASLATLLTGWPGVPMPSLRLIQAPVFHGHSISAWVEFEENPGADALARMLAAAGD
jgi:aspartate-semialdehyde dehydrogenase